MAVVTPIPKESDHEKANNNRPISLLPIVSKVCERTVLNQMIPYLDSNQRLSANQSGNKRFHSTETSLIETTDAILNAIDDKKLTAVALLDMSKAFDSIDHKILLLKLQDIGLSSAALTWFSSSSYLVFEQFLPGFRAVLTWFSSSSYLVFEQFLPGFRAVLTWFSSSSYLVFEQFLPGFRAALT